MCMRCIRFAVYNIQYKQCIICIHLYIYICVFSTYICRQTWFHRHGNHFPSHRWTGHRWQPSPGWRCLQRCLRCLTMTKKRPKTKNGSRSSWGQVEVKVSEAQDLLVDIITMSCLIIGKHGSSMPRGLLLELIVNHLLHWCFPPSYWWFGCKKDIVLGWKRGNPDIHKPMVAIDV